ncbi:MAG: serine/threonine protein kinase [Synergistaceae bacterium]|jgi:serine/threonine protein kinase|nr:serine/threonine protein kinase [Synergistaceae bacterium]
MTDIKQYEPLWGAWYVDSLIGEGSFGKVYKVRKEEFGKTYHSAVKILSIPQSESDLRRARSEGLDDASARSYFHAFVADIIQEVDLMSDLRGNSNIVSFEDHKVIEKESEIGWDILMRMELLTSLSERVTERPMPAGEVAKLGVHICRALELCALRKTIHRDIKPDNIFVSQYGEYKLGDFGIARQIERTMSGLSKKGTETYMAPEVFKGEEYGASVDIYSLGIVMYRYLNQNRPPFQPAFPSVITPRDREEALRRRMRGEALPPIEGVDPSLLAIVLKACAYDRRERFGSAAEMREALLAAQGGRSCAPEMPPASSVGRSAPEPKRTGESTEDATENATERVSNAFATVPESEPTEGVFTGRVDPASPKRGAEPRASAREILPGTTRKLAVLSGACFVLLGALCLPGGMGAGLFIFLPIYVFCAVQCVLELRNGYVNALFLSALVLYLAYSSLFAFEIFDYHVLVMTWSLLALSASKNPSKGVPLCLALAACSVLSGVMAIRAWYGISAGTYHAYVSGATAAPFLMFFIALAGLFLMREKTSATACAALFASQFFPFAASVLRSVSGGDTLSSIAGASFVRMTALPPSAGWRLGAAFVQLFAFASFFALALARTTPDIFARVFGKGGWKKLSLTTAVFVVVIAVLTKVLSA